MSAGATRDLMRLLAVATIAVMGMSAGARAAPVELTCENLDPTYAGRTAMTLRLDTTVRLVVMDPVGLDPSVPRPVLAIQRADDERLVAASSSKDRVYRVTLDLDRRDGTTGLDVVWDGDRPGQLFQSHSAFRCRRAG